ncbi:DUF2892 domain-containing protein [Candidatus Uhrbacteria bacterium]|nr:DUF2892 domain-containing protein [Candidatus Uhrbacteria bacterium]
MKYPINLSAFDRAVRALLALSFLAAAVWLFDRTIAQVLSALVGVGALLEAALGRCPLAHRLGVSSARDRMRPEQIRLVTLAGIQIVLAYEWLVGGIGKLKEGAFVAGMPETLQRFAINNPSTWYRNFLEGWAVENATLLGNLVVWGEILAGTGLVVSAVVYIYAKRASWKTAAIVLAVVSLLVGACMNKNFYFAAGWLSPSTHGLNVIMFWVELLLAYNWIMEWRSARQKS